MKSTASVRLTCLIFAVVALVRASPCSAAVRSSANYSIAAESQDAAGQRANSALYHVDSSLGGINGVSSSASPPAAAKYGFIGQLYEVVALSVSAPPSAALNENTSRQLAAAPLLDDATTLAPIDPSTVAWSIVSGPISSLSASGLATAGTVYQDTSATIGGAAQGLTGQFNLTIVNVNIDNFGSYAADGIDDAWQVQYFGLNNPNAGATADPDGDGETNLFEYTAGLVPTDAASVFRLSVGRVVGQPAQRTLTFSPVVAGRSYTPVVNPGLNSANWTPLVGYTQSDSGATRIVTDPNGTGAAKFYRIQITKP